MDTREFLEYAVRCGVEMDASELWFLSGVGFLVKTEDRVVAPRSVTLGREVVRAGEFCRNASAVRSADNGIQATAYGAPGAG